MRDKRIGWYTSRRWLHRSLRRVHSRHRLRLEEEGDSADPKSQVRLNETIERARAALDEPGTQWLNATHQKTSGGEADARYAAVEKARHIVEATARRHLRL